MVLDYDTVFSFWVGDSCLSNTSTIIATCTQYCKIANLQKYLKSKGICLEEALKESKCPPCYTEDIRNRQIFIWKLE